MDARLLLLLVLIASVPATSVRAQGDPVTPEVGLGYSPGTLTPVNQGIPVYAAGDQLWIVSYGVPLNVELLNASGKPAGSFVIGHMEFVLLRVFGSADKPGVWSLNITIFSNTPTTAPFYLLPVQLVDPGSITPQMTSVHVDSSGLLTLGYKATLGGAYDTSACLAGQNSLETVQIPIPGALGTGQLILSRNGSQTTIQPNGRILNPFSFWFELHAGRSYETQSALITRDTEEAASPPLPFTSGTTNGSTVGLASDTAIRLGRATIRAFFESSTGLQAFQTQVLIPDSSTWEWLSGCSSTFGNLGSNFTASASLKQAPNLWPRAMYFMYSAGGVEGYSRIPITVSPSVVNLVATPWGGPLTDSGLSLAPLSGVTSEVGNSTVFLVSNNYPVEATLQVPGSLATEPLLISEPFSVIAVQVPAGKIAIQSLFDGGPVSNSTVSLRLGNQTVAAGKGSPNFYVPAGSYTLLALYRGINRSMGIVIANGDQTSVSIEFGSPISQLDYLLIGTAILGAVVSAALWIGLARDWRKKS